tara:strand:+ start:282 stop:719 length:438 start_codon:yes stop_codon:yes gene_type:complete
MKLQGNIKVINRLFEVYKKDYEGAMENLQKSYLSDLIKYQDELLLKISTDYGLNYEELYAKYLKNFKKTIKKSKSFQLIDEDELDEELNEIQSTLDDVEPNRVLEKIVLDGSTYYYDQKNGGSIFNKDAEKVGDVNNGKFMLHKN